MNGNRVGYVTNINQPYQLDDIPMIYISWGMVINPS